MHSRVFEPSSSFRNFPSFAFECQSIFPEISAAPGVHSLGTITASVAAKASAGPPATTHCGAAHGVPLCSPTGTRPPEQGPQSTMGPLGTCRPTAPQPLQGSVAPLNPLTLGPTTSNRSPPQRPGNATEQEKFPDFKPCLPSGAHHQPHVSSKLHRRPPASPTARAETYGTTYNLTAAPRPQRAASITSSAPSDSSLSSDTSTRATTPTLDDAPQYPADLAPAATPSPVPRSRRAKQDLNAARVQRSSTQRADSPASERDRDAAPPRRRRFLSSATGQADALAAVEPVHEQGLARMAFAEQQRWITVQQKTFTKWCVAQFGLVFRVLVLRAMLTAGSCAQG